LIVGLNGAPLTVFPLPSVAIVGCRRSPVRLVRAAGVVIPAAGGQQHKEPVDAGLGGSQPGGGVRRGGLGCRRGGLRGGQVAVEPVGVGPGGVALLQGGAVAGRPAVAARPARGGPSAGARQGAGPPAGEQGDWRVLRQALGYCWSVAVTADPAAGLPRFHALERRTHPDVQWIVRENREEGAAIEAAVTLAVDRAVPGPRPVPSGCGRSGAARSPGPS
jgi:hypothetical protein